MEATSLVEALVALLVGIFTGVPTWISAFATLLTFVAAAVALWYARGQILEARRSRELAQYLELERSQPYVVVYTEPSAVQPLFIDLVIKNYGPTAARDIRIEISPWPVRSWPDAGSRVEIPSAIPILAPGQEWRTAWDSTEKRLDAGLPDQHAGIARYEGLQGRQLDSPVVLDWSTYKSRRWMVLRGTHDVANALRDIKTILKSWDEQHNLGVIVRDGDALDDAERAARNKWRNQNAES